MSDIKARYVGHPDGLEDFRVPLANGETVRVQISYGSELPMEINGERVPAAFRDSLLEQEDNWTKVTRQQAKDSKDTTAAEADEKEA